jgi:hypothetical protein
MICFRRSLFGAISVAFFDTTSLYFSRAAAARSVKPVIPRTSARSSTRSF